MNPFRNFNTVTRALFIVFVLAASRAMCGEGMPAIFYSHWTTLTNASQFQKINSTTNLPPEVRNYILTILGSMGVEASDRQRMAEPGESFTAGSRLDWAVTDGKDYIVQYQFVWTFDSHSYFTNTCVAAALYDGKDGKLKCCNGGYMRRFKDLGELIDYDRHLLRR